MTAAQRRILDISFRHRLSHLGSCLTAVGIIEEIFREKKPDEKFILSAGHAGLALYVILEQTLCGDAEKLFLRCGVHPDRLLAPECIDCSTGSLGQGLPIALGIAMADRTKNVYCLISDGECSEGSVWEAMNLRQKYGVSNLKVYVNFNGWGAYDRTRISMVSFLPGVQLRHTFFSEFPFLWGQDAHYHVMTEQEYKSALEL